MDQSLGADVLGHELDVLSETVAGAFDLDDHGVVQQAIQQGCGGSPSGPGLGVSPAEIVFDHCAS